MPFIGIHPECANDKLEQMTNMIEQNHQNISGIGEIGLDPTYVNSNEDTKNKSMSLKHCYLLQKNTTNQFQFIQEKP